MSEGIEQALKEPGVVECPRCYDGTDPRLEDQSCLVCWGERSIDLNNQAWTGQFRKALEHILLHPNWNKSRESLRGCGHD